MAKTTTPVHPAQKTCRACAYPMPASANKCVKCGSVQDWQRYLGFSSAVLGLLVALVSVLTFAIPIWKDNVTPKVARIHATLLDVARDGQSTFLVSNDGTAPAALEAVNLGNKQAVLRYGLDPILPAERIIGPGEAKVYRLSLRVEDEQDIWQLVQIFRNEQSCLVGIVVITTQGVREDTDVDASTAEGGASDSPACRDKTRAAVVYTLVDRVKDKDFVSKLCAVTAAHPNPQHPGTGPGCSKPGDE